MRNVLQSAQTQATEIVSKLEPELNSVQARVKELGPVAIDTTETPELSQQRTQLNQEQTELDSQIKSARLIHVEARQGIEEIAQQRRLRFKTELGQRSQPVLTPRFWANLKRDFPNDWKRFQSLSNDFEKAVQAVPLRTWLVSSALAAVLIVISILLRRSMLEFTIRHTKPTRLRRSLATFFQVIVFTLVPGLIVSVFAHGLEWDQTLDTSLTTLVQACTSAAYMAGFVTGLGKALLSANRPTWRLPPLSNGIARRLSWIAPVLAFLIVITWVSQPLLNLTNASLSTTVLMGNLTTITFSIVIAISAIHLSVALKRSLAEHDPNLPFLPKWLKTLPSLLGIVIGLNLLALLFGFNAFSALVVLELVWVALIFCSAYLMMLLVGDSSQAMLQQLKLWCTNDDISQMQLRTRSQVVIVLSAVLKVALVFSAISLAFSPFGEDPSDWVKRRLGFLYEGFNLGEAVLKPTSLLMALAILLGGVYIIRMLRNWMQEQFLPATRLDPGMRVSASNLFSYVGYFVVGAMTISSLGIGLERMAWILSALSVGIGFGLQAVVQNFVSGLILLAERPIKVGDWVSLNGVEGNVRRINARATEIEMFDRSTLIVPNSEFITKTVRNVTLTNPLGVVKLSLLMPMKTDADQVAEVLRQAMASQADILEDPAPSVSLDGFDANGLAFSANCFVSSPRHSSRVRSALFFEIVRRLRQADLSLHPTQNVTVKPDAQSVASVSGKQGTDEITEALNRK
ncbi:DUF3772 domain-containing protein [Paenalcaligenes niemegkensis]|uniref:DUF3772 domain-containing protein n=1 Tax=Paenalcaligenes niemegkensis TaxID=2895469 RepID=UPI001EE8CC77|nr:DUF3772 domain-containing protein [Paenalcaligenes niemegkensis]MCQ9616091.1 DUF3772 domain-containing protein [Paenalcaligenes niemegkensis]